MRLNKISSNNVFFGQSCEELEHWLHEWEYSKRIVWQEILKARKILRNWLLEKERNHQEQNKITYNILYRIPKYCSNFGRITDSTSARKKASESVSWCSY